VLTTALGLMLGWVLASSTLRLLAFADFLLSTLVVRVSAFAAWDCADAVGSFAIEDDCVAVAADCARFDDFGVSGDFGVTGDFGCTGRCCFATGH